MADNLTKIIISAVDQTQGGLDSVRKNLSGIQSAAATLGVTLSAVGMMTLVKQSIDAADRLNDLSKVTRLTIEQLAGLQLAAKQSGSELDGTANSVSKLAENMGKDGEKFARLGITAKDPIEAFKQLADVFNSIENPQQQAAFGAEALGKSWKSAAPLLAEGSTRIGEMVGQGTELAGNIGELARQSDEFNDRLAVLQATMGGKLTNAVSDLMPLLTAMVSEMGATAQGAGDLNSGFNPLTETLRALIVLGGNFIYTFSALGKLGGGIAAQLSALAQGDMKAFSAINEVMKKDQQESLAAFAKWESGVLSAGKTAAVASKEAGQGVAANSGAIKKFIGETKTAISEYDKLIAKLKGGLVDATAAAQGALYGYNKEQEKALELFASPEWAKMNEKQRIYAAGIMEATIAQAMEIDALEKSKKATEEAIKSNQEYMSGIGQVTEELFAKAKAAEEENALIGMSAGQLAELIAKRYDEQIALKEADAAILRGIPGREAELHMIEQQIAALDRLKKAEVARPALQAQAEAWKNFTRDIESSLTDALMRGFENGNSFGENFVKSLENTLKTAALKIMVQAIVDPVMGGFQGVMQGGGASGGGAMNYLSAGQTIWSGFSGGMASSMGSLAMGAGEMMGSAALTEFGVGATYAGAGGTIAGASAGSAAAGAGAMVATAIPYIAAALAIYSLVKDNGGTPTSSTGNASMQFDSQGNRTGMQTYYGGSSAGVDQMIAGLQSSYMQAAMSLGIGTAATNFSYGGNTGENGQSPNFAMGGGAGSSSFYQAETSTSDAAVQLAASRAVFAALQGSELPVYLRSVFDGLTASTASQDQITNTLQYAQSLKTLRDQLSETRVPLEIATAQMTDLSAEFATSAATFKQDFVSAIDAGINQQTIARWQQLGQAIDQVTQATADATAATLAAAQSVYDTAKTDLIAAYTRESDAAQLLADNMRGFASSFTALRTSLNLGALSTLSPEQKYQEAQRAFDDVSARAQLGDQDAMAQMDSVSQSFLQASRDYNASSEAYAADFSRVSGSLEASGRVASRQADIASQQVTLLQSQLSALGLINTSVLSLGKALLAYRQAATGVVAAGGSATGAYTNYAAADITGYVATNGLTSAQQIYDAAVAGNADPYAVGAAYGLDRAGTDAYLQTNNILRLPGYADGSNVIPFDHVAMVHTGEEIRPAAYVDKDRAERVETNALLREVVAELRADKVQRGSATVETLNRLEVVADKLDGQKRELARNGTNG